MLAPMRMMTALLLALPMLSSQVAPPPDVTATYSGRGEDLVIEFAGNGDLRIEDGWSRYWLSHDGIDYLVEAGPGGPIVERVADIVEAIRDNEPVQGSPGDEGPLVARGPVTVNGRTGTAYGVAVPGAPDWLVISDDPALARVGIAALRRYELVARVYPNPWSKSQLQFLALLRGGAPLRIGEEELKTVRTGAIPASRFALPAEPESAERVRDHWSRPPEPPQSTPDTAFKRAIFAEGRLWVLSDSGRLATIAPGDKAPTEQTTPADLLDLCRAGAMPVAVARNGGRWELWRRRDGAWAPGGTIARREGKEELVALDCAGDRITLLTSRRLIDRTDGGTREVRLSEHIYGGVITTVHDTGDALLYGVDVGEWGGGLHRIDRRTGRVDTIERRGKGLCEGPLNTACDPVNGIAPEPGKPGCLLVAAGLVHMMANGRLVEVCGAAIRSFYYKPYTLEVAPRIDLDGPEPNATVPFYGLAAADDAVWAVASDGLYRIGPDGRIDFRRMPKFENVGGIRLSFAIPDLVLVLTSINGRVSLGGAAPILVVR